MFLYYVYIRSKSELFKVTKYGNINETAPLITKFLSQEIVFVVNFFLPNFKWLEL